MQPKLTVAPPNDITPSDFKQIVEVVESGEAVPALGLDDRLKNAHLIAYAMVQEVVASVSVIKRPQIT